MKRSTIALLIVLAVMIFAPIIAIKIISNLSPETKLKSLKELLDHNENSDAPMRYLVIDDTDNDSVKAGIYIYISTRDKKDSRKGVVFANGENYTGDTLHITDQSGLHNQTLDYEHDTRLIIENHNPNVTLFFPEGNFDRLIIQSQGDVVVKKSNVGILVVQDSIGQSGISCELSNIGTLFAYLNDKCSLSLSSNNIGSAFLPKALDTLLLEGNNIGVTGSTDLIEFNLSKNIGNDSVGSVKFGIGVKYTDDDKEEDKE